MVHDNGRRIQRSGGPIMLAQVFFAYRVRNAFTGMSQIIEWLMPRKKPISLGDWLYKDLAWSVMRLGYLFKEAFEHFGANWILQFRNRFGFDLTNAFAGHFENASDFFERVRVAVGQSVS